jgi:hypothetical protein
MFTRTHRVGKRTYTEVLESYRDSDGRPRHRCIVRWPAELTFAEAIAHAQRELERATRQVAYYRSIIDRTARPRSWKHVAQAPKRLEESTARLDKATAQNAALSTARANGLSADDDAIRQATEAFAARDASRHATFRAFTRPSSALPFNAASLAAQLRALMTQNDLDAIREGLRGIADALDRHREMESAKGENDD